MTDQAPEPMLVLNPVTGRYVNVAPLFEAINEYFSGDFRYAANNIDEAIEHFVCTANDNTASSPITFANHMYYLFKLRNAIRKVTEFKEDRRQA
jgi:hypothetical protein